MAEVTQLKTFFSTELVRRIAADIARVHSPRSISVGQSVTISFELRNAARKPQNLLVDLGVHFVKANGKSRPQGLQTEARHTRGR